MDAEEKIESVDSKRAVKPMISGWTYQILCGLYGCFQNTPTRTVTTVSQIYKFLRAKNCSRTEAFIRESLDRLRSNGLSSKRTDMVADVDYFSLTKEGESLASVLFQDPGIWTEAFRESEDGHFQQAAILAFLSKNPGWHDQKAIATGTGMSGSTIRKSAVTHLLPESKIETRLTHSGIKGSAQNEYRLLNAANAAIESAANFVTAINADPVDEKKAPVSDKDLRQTAMNFGFQLAYGSTPIPPPDGLPIPFPKDNLKDGWMDEVLGDAPEPGVVPPPPEFDPQPEGEVPQEEIPSDEAVSVLMLVIPTRLHNYLTAMAVLRGINLEALVQGVLGVAVETVQNEVHCQSSPWTY